MDYIISKQDRQDDTYFLVKWSGKTHADNSWEPLSSIMKQPNFDYLMSTAAMQQQKNSTNTNGRTLGRKSTQTQQGIKTINLGTLKVKIPCHKKQISNWIYGDKVQQVLTRNHLLQKYKVRWNDGCLSWQDQQQLLVKQPQRMIDFLQKQLNIPIS